MSAYSEHSIHPARMTADTPPVHVADRYGLIWRVVRDGGMATRADGIGLITMGIHVLDQEHGPLTYVVFRPGLTDEPIDLVPVDDDTLRQLGMI